MKYEVSLYTGVEYVVARYKNVPADTLVATDTRLTFITAEGKAVSTSLRYPLEQQ